MVASFSWSVNSDYSMQERALLVIFSLFPWLPICLNFYVFYGFIHLLLGRTTDSENPWHRTRVFHWACFIVVVLVACLCSSLNCVLSFGVGRGLFAHLVRITGALPSAIEFATEIVAWVASTENWGWSIFLAVRHPRCVGGHIVSDLENVPHSKRTTDHKPAAAAPNPPSSPSNHVLVYRSFLTHRRQSPLLHQHPGWGYRDQQPGHSGIRLRWTGDLGYPRVYHHSRLLGCDSGVLLPLDETAQQKR